MLEKQLYMSPLMVAMGKADRTGNANPSLSFFVKRDCLAAKVLESRSANKMPKRDYPFLLLKRVALHD